MQLQGQVVGLDTAPLIYLIEQNEPYLAMELDIFPDVQPFYSAISVLRDGSILSPVDFLTPVADEIF